MRYINHCHDLKKEQQSESQILLHLSPMQHIFSATTLKNHWRINSNLGKLQLFGNKSSVPSNALKVKDKIYQFRYSHTLYL